MMWASARFSVLYDWRFEVMGLLYHARELEARYNIGPHTISFPRIEPASGSEMASNAAVHAFR